MNIVNGRFGYIFNLFSATLTVFFFLFSVLNIIGFVPEPKEEIESVIKIVSANEVKNNSPSRIIIDSIGVDTIIVSPSSRDISVLDDALKNGVVHYPGSGEIASSETMFLFGHSSGLPVIHNEMYKVFNHLSELESGNTIRIQGEGTENVYRVTSVELVDAGKALVDLSGNNRELIISTCNSFGAKSERFVVHADYVGSYTFN